MKINVINPIYLITEMHILGAQKKELTVGI
jgi:hypothetical protein